MNILFLAPHPFYQERGTPIAVDLLLRALSGRGDQVDLVTFHEGDNRTYRNVTIHRIRNLRWVRKIRPGFSWKKIVCNFFLLARALRLAARKKHQIVHAVEDAVFIAWLIRLLYRIPYVFDMDSSMPAQLVEQHPALAAAAPFLKFFEAQAARRAFAVIAVCETLAETARAHGAQRVFLLRDISLLHAAVSDTQNYYTHPALPGSAGALRRGERAPLQRRGTEYDPLPGGTGVGRPLLIPGIESLNVEHPCLMYIGNLEKYQGIDLLLESFAVLLRSFPKTFLAVIGGNRETIAKYEGKAHALGIAARVRFFGARPLASMRVLFAQADILVSPRIQGANTPMKIYSYLESGKPILATDLPTHTQLLDRSVAMLAAPVADEFAAAMLGLLKNPSMGRQLARRASALAGEKYSFKAFCETVRQIYGQIESDLQACQK